MITNDEAVLLYSALSCALIKLWRVVSFSSNVPAVKTLNGYAITSAGMVAVNGIVSNDSE